MLLRNGATAANAIQPVMGELTKEVAVVHTKEESIATAAPIIAMVSINNENGPGKAIL